MFLLVFSYVASAQAPRVVEIARAPSWVSAYWGYSTPKIVFDGNAYYTAGLWGDTPETSHGVIYKFDGTKWLEGAQLPNIYQPATLLLDSQQRLILIYNMQEKPVVVLRAKAAGNNSVFDTLPPPPDMKNGYYLGAAIYNDHVYLAYVTIPSYSMLLTELDISTNTWTASSMMAEGQIEKKPKTAWTYPILVPGKDGLRIAASSCPDGGDGNTYDKVWYLFYPAGAHEPSQRELVAQSPIGSNAYSMDMAVDAQGIVHVVHMWNGYKYGDALPAGSPEPGIYDSFRDPVSGSWAHEHIAPICIAGYWKAGEKLQLIYQDQGALVSRDWLPDTKKWNEPQTILANGKGPGVPTFMDVLNANGGSKQPAALTLVTSSNPPGTEKIATQILWSILP